MFAAAENRVDAIRAAARARRRRDHQDQDHRHRASVALDRAAGNVQKKVLEASVAKGQQPTPRQVQAAIEASRELYRVRQDSAAGGETGRRPRRTRRGRRRQRRQQLQPGRDQPAGLEQGRHDRAAARRAAGPSRGRARAARRRRADRSAGLGRRDQPAADGGDQRRVRPRDVPHRARRQREPRGRRQRRDAAVGGRQHAVAAAHALSAAAGDGAAEGDLSRRHEGAARPRAPIRTRGSRRIPGIWSTAAAATATAASPIPRARPRSGAPPTPPTSRR